MGYGSREAPDFHGEQSVVSHQLRTVRRWLEESGSGIGIGIGIEWHDMAWHEFRARDVRFVSIPMPILIPTPMEAKNRKIANNAHPRTAIPLRCIGVGTLGRWLIGVT